MINVFTENIPMRNFFRLHFKPKLCGRIFTERFHHSGFTLSYRNFSWYELLRIDKRDFSRNPLRKKRGKGVRVNVTMSYFMCTALEITAFLLEKKCGKKEICKYVY